MLLVHILAFQAGQLRDPQPAPQSHFGHRGERRSLFFQEFHDLYGIFFLLTKAWPVTSAMIWVQISLFQPPTMPMKPSMRNPVFSIASQIQRV